MKEKLKAVKGFCKENVVIYNLLKKSCFILTVYYSFLSNTYSQNVGINTTGANANSKALLDIDADNVTGEKKGLLVPRMTTAERNTLSSTGTMTESSLIYNKTTQCFEAWSQSSLSWVAFGCINCQLPGVFLATAALADCSSFSANWNSSAGATGYFLDVSTSSTFASFVTGYNNLPVGNVIAYPVTGLTTGITYYYRVRAVNTCGTSISSNTIIAMLLSAASPLAAGCNPCQVESDYGTVVTSLSGSSKRWITRNLGATAIASSASSTINAQAGCYYQFNRSQAYGIDNGGSVNPAWTITSIIENNDWLIANDPCRLRLGGSWRLPTRTEWINVRTNGGWINAASAFSSVLKMHMAGYLSFSNGALNFRGTYNETWSSSNYAISPFSAAYTINYDNSSIVAVYNDNKAYGFNVRCLR